MEIASKNSEKKGESNRVAVLDKAIKIIALLEGTNSGIGLTEISKKTEVNKASCYRILQTLMSDNIVEYGDLPGTYRLGTRLLELGSIVQRRINVREIALPILKQITKETEDTSYLCILNQDKALCVERIAGLHVQVLILEIGDSWPLYKGAAPRAILAYLEDREINNILSSPSESFTKLDHKDVDYYWERVHETRKKGYSVSYEEVVTGVSSIGAPIFDHLGNVIASISLSTTTQRLPLEKEPKIGELLINAASKISKLLGSKL